MHPDDGHVVSAPLRCAVAGLGVGWHHAELVQAQPHTQLVAVADIDVGVRRRAATTFQTAQVHAEASELLERHDVDVLIVSTYDAEHGQLAAHAIDRGVHCFVEKPLCTTTSDLYAIVSALDGQPQVRMTTNTLLRRSPRFAWLHDQIASGSLGDIFHVEADYLYGRVDKLLYGWRGADDDYSPTLGGAIHVIDLVMWLLGEAPSAVQGIGSGRASGLLRDARRSRYRGHDLHLALLTFRSGVTVKIGANFACVVPHFHRLEVYGTAATFVNSPGGDRDGTPPAWLWRSRDPGVPPEAVEVPYPAVAKVTILEEFLLALREEHTIPIAEREVIDAAAVALAIDASIRSGQPVAVDYPALARQA